MGELFFYSNVTIKIGEKNGEAKTIGKLIAKQPTKLQKAKSICFLNNKIIGLCLNCVKLSPFYRCQMSLIIQ